MIAKILVPTDGSEDALEAARYAAALARALDAQVAILHVVEVPRLPPILSSFTARQKQQVAHDLREAGRAIMAMTKEPFEQANVPVSEELREGRAAQVIAATAEQGGYDLVVVGSQGVSGVARLILGSVSEELMRGAPCPVLVVRKKSKARGA